MSEAIGQLRLRWTVSSGGLQLGAVIVTLSLVLAAFGPMLAPFNPEAADPLAALSPPAWPHLMGTDLTGMDVFSRVISAPRVDIVIAITATALSMVIGIPLGVWAGYFGETSGWNSRASEALLRGLDVLQAFPVFVLALGLVAAAGPSILIVIAVATFLNTPVFIRLTRSSVLSVRDRLFVEAARCIGNSDSRLLLKHVLPNSMGPALANAPGTIGAAILLTAGLSFVGAGVRVPTPEWGSMIAVGAHTTAAGQWWPAVFPGLALGVTVLGYVLLADGLRDLFDPIKRDR